MKGKLYVIGTPIGNLGDITFRAIDTLKKVDYIAVEDTRISLRLLKKYKIKKELIPFHIKNEKFKVTYIIDLLNKGKDIGLISDAGTPCISDPGYLLVSKARQLEIDVYSIPGASSLIAALSTSGLPSERFFFEGFLPKKKGRSSRMNDLSIMDVSIILFESPHRLLKTLNDILDIMGDRFISVCKEITKLNESNYYDKVSNIIKVFNNISKVKGEYVIVISKSGYNE